jgi:hypothetical protein
LHYPVAELYSPPGKVAAAAKNNLERPQTELALRAIPGSKKSKLLQINLFFKYHSDK